MERRFRPRPQLIEVYSFCSGRAVRGGGLFLVELLHHRHRGEACFPVAADVAVWADEIAVGVTGRVGPGMACVNPEGAARHIRRAQTLELRRSRERLKLCSPRPVFAAGITELAQHDRFPGTLSVECGQLLLHVARRLREFRLQRGRVDPPVEKAKTRIDVDDDDIIEAIKRLPIFLVSSRRPASVIFLSQGSEGSGQ